MPTDLSRLLARCGEATLPEIPAAGWSVVQPEEEGYAQAANQAFSFFRSAASGRYSSRTLMRLADLGDSRPGRALPVILTVGRPFTYCEETETKTGGMQGMCVWWPDENGRCLLAITPSARRKKIGTVLVRFILDYLDHAGTPSFWVARTNRNAQHFLLKLGFVPSAINSNGAVQYGVGTPEERGDDEVASQPESRRNAEGFRALVLEEDDEPYLPPVLAEPW